MIRQWCFVKYRRNIVPTLSRLLHRKYVYRVAMQNAFLTVDHGSKGTDVTDKGSRTTRLLRYSRGRLIVLFRERGKSVAIPFVIANLGPRNRFHLPWLLRWNCLREHRSALSYIPRYRNNKKKKKKKKESRNRHVPVARKSSGFSRLYSSNRTR